MNGINKQIEIYTKVLSDLKRSRPLTATANLPEKNKQKVLDLFDKKIKKIENKIVQLRLRAAQKTRTS